MLIERGADVHSPTDTEGAALTSACFHGHEQVARMLLDAGADFGHAGTDSVTVRIFACQEG